MAVPSTNAIQPFAQNKISIQVVGLIVSVLGAFLRKSRLCKGGKWAQWASLVLNDEKKSMLEDSDQVGCFWTSREDGVEGRLWPMSWAPRDTSHEHFFTKMTAAQGVVYGAWCATNLRMT
eukprot:1007614-Amphidinium_carterae.1